MITAVLLYQMSLSRGPAVQKNSDDLIEYSAVQLFPQSMPVLSDGAYELIVTDEQGARSVLGRFLTTADSQVTNVTGMRMTNAVFALPKKVTGLEKAEIRLVERQAGRQPFSIEFLTGDFRQDRAVTTFAQDVFSQAQGQFSLATPTDGNDTLNERSGLWFGDVARSASSLTLPALKQGWTYEGWAIVDGRPLTTGRFQGAHQRDAFSGFSSNQSPAPSIPGEDFLLDPPVLVFPGLTFPLDLAGDIARISIEPDFGGVDPTGQSPFGVNVLHGEIPNRADPRRLYDMEQQLESAPKATVVLR